MINDNTTFKGTLFLDKVMSPDDRRWFQDICTRDTSEREDFKYSPGGLCEWDYDSDLNFPILFPAKGTLSNVIPWLFWLRATLIRPKGYLLNGVVRWSSNVGCVDDEKVSLDAAGSIVIIDNVLHIREDVDTQEDDHFGYQYVLVYTDGKRRPLTSPVVATGMEMEGKAMWLGYYKSPYVRNALHAFFPMEMAEEAIACTCDAIKRGESKLQLFKYEVRLQKIKVQIVPRKAR